MRNTMHASTSLPTLLSAFTSTNDHGTGYTSFDSGRITVAKPYERDNENAIPAEELIGTGRRIL